MRTADVDIARDADACYRLLCDIERVPEWVASVSGVRVLAADDRGRPTRVSFIGGAGSASHAYRLVYAYDDGMRRLCWGIDDATLRDLDGEATVESLGPNRCRLHYRLHASTAILGPGGVTLRDEDPEPIARAFARWVERMA